MLRSDVLVQQLYVNYKSKLIQIYRGLCQPFQPNRSACENSDKNLICKKSTKENIKLGDRVKIKLKKRQLKQQQQEEWNELMTKDLGKVGTVILILADGANEPVVHFPDTGHRWLIQPSALSNVSDQFASDGSDRDAHLKVGDYVCVGYGGAVVKQIQGPKSNPWQQVLMFQEFLGKILSFEANGHAYVSAGDKMSLSINPAILKRRVSDARKAELERPLNFQLTEMQKKFQLHSDVQIKNDVKEFVKQPFWRYQLTQILGAKGKVSYHGMAGEVGITIKEQTWILPYMMLEKLEKKKRTRHNSNSPQSNKEFPFTFNDLVIFKCAFRPSFARTLDELHLPISFAKACHGLAKFLGYSSPTKCVVEMDGNKLQVNMIDLLPSSALKVSKDGKFKLAEKRHEKLKVGDDVQFNIGSKTLAKHVLNELNISGILHKIILSPAKLEAFDDDKDLALLRYADCKCFWVDPSFITFLDDTIDVNFLVTSNLSSLTDNAHNNTTVSKNKTPPTVNITEAMDFVEQVKSILQSLSIQFNKPDLRFGRILVATIEIGVKSGDEIITEICNEIESTLSTNVSKEELQLAFKNVQNSAAIRLKITEAQLVKHNPTESIQTNNDIACEKRDKLSAIPITDDALVEANNEIIQPTDILGVPDSDQQENTDQVQPVLGAIQQNETNGPNFQDISHAVSRQSSNVEERYRQSGNIFNFYYCPITNSNLGGSN